MSKGWDAHMTSLAKEIKAVEELIFPLTQDPKVSQYIALKNLLDDLHAQEEELKGKPPKGKEVRCFWKGCGRVLISDQGNIMHPYKKKGRGFYCEEHQGEPVLPT